jgi:hypothetical protein
VRIRGEAVWARLGVTEWSVIPCNVSVTDVFVKDPVLLVAETRSRLIARSTGSHLAMWDDQQNYFAAYRNRSASPAPRSSHPRLA